MFTEMKHLIRMATCLVFLTFVKSCSAELDPIFSPISAYELKTQIVANDRDPSKIVSVLNRAFRQNQSDAAYEILLAETKRDPSNMVAKEAFCLVWNDQRARYLFHQVGGGSAKIVSSDRDLYHQYLAEAYAKDPKPWLALWVDGLYEFFSESRLTSGLLKLERAEKIAPDVSYTHLALGDVYDYYKLPNSSPSRALAEALMAHKIDPTSIFAANELFRIYAFELKDHNEALRWKRIAISLAPSFGSLGPMAQRTFSNYN